MSERSTPAAGASRFRCRPRGRARLLLVSLAYSDLPRPDGKLESGDAHFSVGLREHRHPTARKATPIAVTTRVRVSCDGNDASAGKLPDQPGGHGPPPARQQGRLPRRPRADPRPRGAAHVATATVRTTVGCRYRLQNRAFALAADTFAITVETRFLGNAALAALSAPTNRIDLRS